MGGRVNKKFILLVGVGTSFVDSFRLFTENAYDGYFVPTKSHINTYQNNDSILRQVGFTRITNVGQFADNIAAKNYEAGIVITGGDFEPDKLIYPYDNGCLEKLQCFHYLSGTLKSRIPNIVCVRYDSDETFFFSDQARDQYVLGNEHTDVIITVNETLEAYIKSNCPALADKNFSSGNFAMPLTRTVTKLAQRPQIEKYVLLGRFLSPVRLHKDTPPVQAIGWKENLFVAHGGDLATIERSREQAKQIFPKYLGGFGPFYDYAINHSRSVEEIVNAPTTLQNYQLGKASYKHPMIFRLTNFAGKVICYLMMGLQPVIPDDKQNPANKELLRRGMAIPVGHDGVVPNLADNEIVRMRENIIANKELFTFDSTFQKLDNFVDRISAGESALGLY